MAEQKSIIKLKGTIGDITFYKSKDGYLARTRGGVDAARIATDPRFQRTRENGSEFGRAGQSSKLLRIAFSKVISKTSSSGLTGRLMQQMMRVIQADSISDRGLRNVLDGELELLTGFEFNTSASLSGTLLMPYTTSIDRVAGVLMASFPVFNPLVDLKFPAVATHFKLISSGSLIDFEAKTYQTQNNETEFLDIRAGLIAAPIELEHVVVANATQPLFLALGIEFYQLVNGKYYLLSNGVFNALSLVAISGQ